MAKKRSAKKSSRAKKAKTKRAKTKKRTTTKKRAAGPSLESLAKKIVRLTQLPTFGEAELRALYNEGCSSQEATGNVDRGFAGLEEKGKRWSQMQTGTTWKATNVWVGPRTICIEWDATVNTRDGRTVSLQEVAVHEIVNGKIQNERFYYNPMALAPPQS